MSLVDVSLANADYLAWLVAKNDKLYKLGAIPDSGEYNKLRFSLPKKLNLHAGNRIIVARINKGETNSFPPSSPKLLDYGELIEI